MKIRLLAEHDMIFNENSEAKAVLTYLKPVIKQIQTLKEQAKQIKCEAVALDWRSSCRSEEAALAMAAAKPCQHDVVLSFHPIPASWYLTETDNPSFTCYSLQQQAIVVRAPSLRLHEP